MQEAKVEEGKYEGYGGVEELKEKNKTKQKKKNCPFLAPLKHQQALTTAAGVFLGPDTALRHLLLEASPSLLKDMIVIVHISLGEWDGPGPNLPQASTHLNERLYCSNPG